MIERLALIYPDGSITVLGESTGIDAARNEAELADRGERDPACLTKIARIELKLLEIVDEPPTEQTFVDRTSARESNEFPVATCPAELAVRLYEANCRRKRPFQDAMAVLAAMDAEYAESWLRSAKAAADYFVELINMQWFT
jgi:hypothetical protein